MATREELHQLVTSLPEGAFEAAHQTLTRLQMWPPPPPPGRDEAIERFRQNQLRHHEKMMARMSPGQVSLGGGGLSTGPGGRRRGRHSFGYHDAGDDVHETSIVHDDCEFMLIERIRRDAATREVHFVIEVTGPDATTARHEHRYPLP